MSNKPLSRIAIFSMNIFGDDQSIGIPVLRDLFSNLTLRHKVVFYSFQEIDQSFVPLEIKLRKPIPGFLPGRLRYLLILLRFLFDNFLRKYKLLFAVSAYPTGLWAVRAGKVSGCPTLVQFIALEAVGLHDINAGNLAKPWLRKITEYVSEQADYLITVSQYQKALAIKNLNLKREIIDLPLRIDPKKFQFRKKSVQQPIHFIQIGYYSSVKDQDTLFKAFAMVSKQIDCKLTVIGDGFNNPKVDGLLHSLKIKEKTRLVGIVSQQVLSGYLNEAHILLHTARFETGCAAIQEAMASGVAVCGTNVGLLSDVGSDYAIIVPAQDPKKLAEQVLNLLSDASKFDRIILNAFNWITKYDNWWSFKNYVEVFDRVVQKTVD